VEGDSASLGTVSKKSEHETVVSANAPITIYLQIDFMIEMFFCVMN